MVILSTWSQPQSNWVLLDIMISLYDIIIFDHSSPLYQNHQLKKKTRKNSLPHLFPHKVLPSFQTFPPVDCDPVVFSKFVGSALRPYVPPPPYHHDVRSAPTVAVAINVERSSDPIGVVPYVLVWKDIGGSWQSFKNWKPASRHWVIDWSFETLHFEHLTMKPQTSAEHWRKPSLISWIPWFANYVLLTVNLLRYVILKTVFLAILVMLQPFSLFP